VARDNAGRNTRGHREFLPLLRAGDIMLHRPADLPMKLFDLPTCLSKFLALGLGVSTTWWRWRLTKGPARI
jgi:hypothetical protein